MRAVLDYGCIVYMSAAESNLKSFYSFGWIGYDKVHGVGLCHLKPSLTVPSSAIPHWRFFMPSIDTSLQQKVKDKAKLVPKGTIVQNYVYQHKIFIFTDGSKEPETGHTGAAFFIPQCEAAVKERASDPLSVYAAELLRILSALQ